MENSAPSPSSSSVSVVESSSSVFGRLGRFRFLLPPTALFRAVFDWAGAGATGFAVEVVEVCGGGVIPLVFFWDDRSEMAGETEGPRGCWYASNSEEDEDGVALFASSDRGELKNWNCCE